LYKNIRKDSKKKDKTFRLRHYNLPEYFVFFEFSWSFERDKT